MKKILSLIAALVMAAGASTYVYADPEVQSPDDGGIISEYVYTQLVESNLDIDGRRATCSSNVEGISGTVTKIVVYQTLMKKNGSRWDEYASWSRTYYSSSCTFINTRYNLPSGTYMVETYAKVYSNSVFEPVTAYSVEVTG